jgi:hypothetical protein
MIMIMIVHNFTVLFFVNKYFHFLSGYVRISSTTPKLCSLGLSSISVQSDFWLTQPTQQAEHIFILRELPGCYKHVKEIPEVCQNQDIQNAENISESRDF